MSSGKKGGGRRALTQGSYPTEIVALFVLGTLLYKAPYSRRK